MSLTSTSRRPCSASIRSTSAATCVRLEVVDGDRDPLAARLAHELGGLLDRLRPVVLGAPLAGAAARAVDGGARLAERDRDPAAGPRVAWPRARPAFERRVSSGALHRSRGDPGGPVAGSARAPRRARARRPASCTAPSTSPKTRNASSTVTTGSTVERIEARRAHARGPRRRARSRRPSRSPPAPASQPQPAVVGPARIRSASERQREPGAAPVQTSAAEHERAHAPRRAR